MPHVDSLLSLADRAGADELRVGTDKAPAMFALGAPRKLAIPATTADTLRHLLEGLFGADEAQRLQRDGRTELLHEVAGVGRFEVVVTQRPGEPGAIDAVFKRAKAASSTQGAPPSPVARPPLPARPAPARAVPAAAVSPAAVSPVSVTTTAAAPSATAPIVTASEGATVQPSEELIRLLLRALALRGSDLHVGAGEPPSVRVDGGLVVLSDEGTVDVQAVTASLLDEAGRDKLRQGVSIDLALSLPTNDDGGYRGGRGQGFGPKAPRVRGNVYRTSRGLAAAFRLLSPEAPLLDSLMMPVPIGDLPMLPNGLVIVCGPTGSGKSTTLAALAREAQARRSIVLVSLEDPIEYDLGGATSSLVRQRQIGRDVCDFATGLRDALREDPDVILVGEMRDADSISLALTAAETGHLVLTTLHARSAASAIERIVDVYPEGRQNQIRVQLADCLRSVVAQRLIPRAHGSGRVLAAEVLRGTASVGNAIREGKLAQIVSSMQAGRRDGMIPLEKCLADLVRQGEVALEEARAVANDADTLATYLRGV